MENWLVELKTGTTNTKHMKDTHYHLSPVQLAQFQELPMYKACLWYF
jgi:hypothetical protein